MQMKGGFVDRFPEGAPSAPPVCVPPDPSHFFLLLFYFFPHTRSFPPHFFPLAPGDALLHHQHTLPTEPPTT